MIVFVPLLAEASMTAAAANEMPEPNFRPAAPERLTLVAKAETKPVNTLAVVPLLTMFTVVAFASVYVPAVIPLRL